MSGGTPLLSGILTLGFGLGVYAYFLILVGSLGWLRPGIVLLFLALCLTFSWRRGMKVFRWLKDVMQSFWNTSGVFSQFCQLSLIGTFFFTVLFCFLPEIANDALGIHLYVAKLFVKNASISPSFYDLFSYRPLLMSAMYSTGLLFQNVAIAKFFHWVCGVLLVGTLAIKVMEVTQSKKIALFLGLMLWLTPTLMNQITTTYIDAGVSFFIFLGYCVVMDCFDDLKPSNFFYGGLLIGLAVAIRSLALGAFFSVIVMLGFRLFQRDLKMRVTIAGMCFALGVLLTSAYWFLRDWVYTGNPVYPYLGSLFGNEELSFLTSLYFHKLGLPKSPASFLMIPWSITFKPQYFDYHHWVGPFYLSVLPVVLYAAIQFKEARRHLQFVLFFIIFWYFTGQVVRYLLPALPVYLLAAAIGLRELSVRFLQEARRNFLAKTVSCLAITSLLCLTGYHFRYQFAPVLRVWSSTEYLQKMERTIPIVEWVNKNLPQNAKILNFGEAHLFYFEREMILDVEFRLRTHYDQKSSPAAMAVFLREKGITHILDTTEIHTQDILENSKDHYRPIELLLSDRRFTQPLISIQSLNVIDRRCQYILYKLV